MGKSQVRHATTSAEVNKRFVGRVKGFFCNQNLKGKHYHPSWAFSFTNEYSWVTDFARYIDRLEGNVQIVVHLENQVGTSFTGLNQIIAATSWLFSINC